jgi:Domain of unknown function (DUF4160)
MMSNYSVAMWSRGEVRSTAQVSEGILASNIGFSAKELGKLQAIVQENQEILLEAWYGYFGNSSR